MEGIRDNVRYLLFVLSAILSGRTVRACAEQFRDPSFVLCLLARFAELTRNPVV
jgi:hypothetical protein